MITNWDYKRLTLWILTQLLRHPIRVGLGPISIIIQPMPRFIFQDTRAYWDSRTTLAGAQD